MLKEAAIVQARVIGALVLRETRVRYGRSQFGYLWAFGQPLVWITAISTMFSLTGAHPPFGDSMSLFVSLGVMPYNLYKGLANQCGNSLKANQALLTFPIVKELDTIIARAVLESATFFLIMIIVLTGQVFLLDAPLPNDLFEMGEAFLGLILFGFGLGLLNAVIDFKFNSWMNFFSLLSTPLFWISGIFFSLESIPSAFRKVIVWNPIIHGLEGMRAGYFQNYRTTHLDLAYLYECGLILILVGLAAERAIRMRKT